MNRPFPLKIGLPGGLRQLRMEKVPDDEIYDESFSWIIWLGANADFTLGTFIKLGGNGTVQRITLHPDGTESIFDVITLKEVV
jgi:hypothetical protein